MQCMLNNDLAQFMQSQFLDYTLEYAKMEQAKEHTDSCWVGVGSGVKMVLVQARIHTGFHRFTKIGQSFHR